MGGMKGPQKNVSIAATPPLLHVSAQRTQALRPAASVPLRASPRRVELVPHMPSYTWVRIRERRAGDAQGVARWEGRSGPASACPPASSRAAARSPRFLPADAREVAPPVVASKDAS